MLFLIKKGFILISLFSQLMLRFECLIKHSQILPNISRTNYAVFGFHDGSLSLSRSNRCLFYPRCLMFACCDKTLIERISSYFHGDGSFPMHFSCMKTGQCSYSSPLAERLRNLEIMNTTLTIDLLADLLLTLPPTSPRVYKELAARTEFKVLYLTQGDYFSKLESCLHQFEDMIFLSYKEKMHGKCFLFFILFLNIIYFIAFTHSLYCTLYIYLTNTNRPLIFSLRKIRSWTNGFVLGG